VDNPLGFEGALRGYDMSAVEAFVQRVELAFVSTDPEVRAAALAYARGIEFPRRFRGYERRQIDRYVAQIVRDLSEA
jgi:hypothetical protein